MAAPARILARTHRDPLGLARGRDLAAGGVDERLRQGAETTAQRGRRRGESAQVRRGGLRRDGDVGDVARGPGVLHRVHLSADQALGRQSYRRLLAAGVLRRGRRGGIGPARRRRHTAGGRARRPAEAGPVAGRNRCPGVGGQSRLAQSRFARGVTAQTARAGQPAAQTPARPRCEQDRRRARPTGVGGTRQARRRPGHAVGAGAPFRRRGLSRRGVLRGRRRSTHRGPAAGVRRRQGGRIDPLRAGRHRLRRRDADLRSHRRRGPARRAGGRRGVRLSDGELHPGGDRRLDRVPVPVPHTAGRRRGVREGVRAAGGGGPPPPRPRWRGPGGGHPAGGGAGGGCSFSFSSPPPPRPPWGFLARSGPRGGWPPPRLRARLRWPA